MAGSSSDPLAFTVWGQPVAKPTMTRWNKAKPNVVAYFEWCNMARACAVEQGVNLASIQDRALIMLLVVYIDFPPSYTGPRRRKLMGMPKLTRPDITNYQKGIEDALIENDSKVYDIHAIKYWDDGKGPRVEVRIW